MKYCIHCGHKQESQHANFCSSCGEPLSSVIQTTSKIISRRQSIRDIQAISDDETDATFVPQLDKLEVEVEMPSNVTTISTKGDRVVFESSKFKKRTLEL